MDRKNHSIDLLSHLTVSKCLRWVVVTLPLQQACHWGANLWQFSIVLCEPELLLTSEEKVEVSKDLQKYFQQDGHWAQPGHEGFVHWLCSVAETLAWRDSQQASTSPWGFPVLSSLWRNTYLCSAAWELEHLPRKCKTLAITLVLGDAETTPSLSQSLGSTWLLDNLQCRWSWTTVQKRLQKIHGTRKRKLMGNGEISIPNTVCAFYPMSLKWVLHRQSSDQEPEWETSLPQKAVDICALLFALSG